jgi:hypothetical protein
MQLCKTALVRSFFIMCAFAAAPLYAQSVPTDHPALYSYVSQWAVPRAQWGDMAKFETGDRPILDKLVADGTLVGYGAYSNLIHQEGEPTHGDWLTATSEGNLLKALEALYAHPGSTNAPVQANSKHWDQVFQQDLYGGKPATLTGGYLAWSQWVVKPGQMQAYKNFQKRTFVPVFDKLVAEGVLTAYGTMTEDYHTQKLGTVYDYLLVADAAAIDKVNKALDDLLMSNPTISEAFQALTERDGHRDYLTHVSFSVSK